MDPKSGYLNLSVIGTSHISKESIDEIKSFIEEEKPEIVAIELDRSRFQALVSNQKRSISLLSIWRLGLNGFLFLILGQWAQKVLGKMVGIKPGTEMLTAIKLAKKHHLSISLIDQDIEITLSRFSKALSLKERLRIVWDISTGAMLGKDELRKAGIKSIDLSKVPDQETINKLMVIVRNRYPNIHRVLVEERNVFMAKKLVALMAKNPQKRILAVVGAGHEREILELIRLYNDEASLSFVVEYK